MSYFSIRPVSEQQARVMLMGKTMFPVLFQILAMLIISFVYAWRTLWWQPYYFWRPFTLASLAFALIAAIFWPFLGGQVLYETIYGTSPFESLEFPGITLGTAIYCSISYIIWSVVMFPHTITRIVCLLAVRNDSPVSQ